MANAKPAIIRVFILLKPLFLVFFRSIRQHCFMQDECNHNQLQNSNAIKNTLTPERAETHRRNCSGNLYRFPLRLSVALIHSEKQIPALVGIEIQCFPTRMQQARQEFATFLEDEYATGLILYEDEKPIGYMLGYHIHELNSARALESDAFIRENQDVIFYISSLAILKGHRSVITLEFLIHEMAGLLKSIGYDYFVAYVRKRNGLSRLLAQRLSCEILHTQDNWEDTGEPFDYCLVDLASVPTLPAYADHAFTWLRNARKRIRSLLGKAYRSGSPAGTQT